MNKVFSTYLPKGITNKQQRGSCLPKPWSKWMYKQVSDYPRLCGWTQGTESEQGVHQYPHHHHHVLKTDSLQARRINPLLLQRKQLKFKLPRVPNGTSCEFMLVCSKSRVPRGTGQKQSSILRFMKSSLNNCPREMDRSQSRRSSERGNKEPGKTQQKQYTAENTHQHLGQWGCHRA